MALPLNVAPVLTLFQRRVFAYDLIGRIVDYESRQTKSERYSFVGVLIPPTDKDLQLFDEGELAAGAMVLYVPAKIKLHISDAIADKSVETRQTIVLFDGDEYRLKGVSNRTTDGLHRKYTMVRYMGERTNGNV